MLKKEMTFKTFNKVMPEEPLQGIYLLTNLKDKKRYVGQSIDIKRRFDTYNRKACKGQPKLYESLKNSHQDDWKLEILELVEDRLDLFIEETKWIKKLKTEKELNCISGDINFVDKKTIIEEIKRELEKRLSSIKSRHAFGIYDLDGRGLIPNIFKAFELEINNYKLTSNQLKECLLAIRQLYLGSFKIMRLFPKPDETHFNYESDIFDEALKHESHTATGKYNHLDYCFIDINIYDLIKETSKVAVVENKWVKIKIPITISDQFDRIIIVEKKNA